MKEIVADRTRVAYCGLYCGACGSYIKERCPGCHENVKARWCKIRTCCGEHGYASCADCVEFTDPNHCNKFNNLVSKVVGVVLNSNRRGCVLKVRELGLDGFAALMAERKSPSLPRRGR